MGDLTKIPKECLDTSKQYAKAYSYRVSSLIEPILIYKSIGDPKYVYRIANPEVCKMRYVAEAIYAMLHERNKKLVAIECDNLRIECHPADSELDIFIKLLVIEQEYFDTKKQ